MYSLTNFGRMITDTVRHRAYVEALRRHVRPDSVVLDIGTGSGVYALIAARMGARRVYAIDPNPCVQVGRETAARNGLGDRVDFRCGVSTDITLPERADLIISDLRGTLPFHGHHFSSVADARRRHLAPGGVMLPTRDTVYAALVEAPSMRDTITAPWDGSEFGLDLTLAIGYEADVPRATSLDSESLLTAPVRFAELDYARSVDLDLEAVDYHLDIAIPAERAGTADAIALWFDATVVDDITYTSGPFGPPTVYRTQLLPLRTPIAVVAGDAVHADVRCRLHSSWRWSWQVEVTGPSGVRRGSQVRQSTVAGTILADEFLRVAVGRDTPANCEVLAKDAFVLALLARGASVPEAARELRVAHGLSEEAAREITIRLAALHTPC